MWEREVLRGSGGQKEGVGGGVIKTTVDIHEIVKNFRKKGGWCSSMTLFV